MQSELASNSVGCRANASMYQLQVSDLVSLRTRSSAAAYALRLAVIHGRIDTVKLLLLDPRGKALAARPQPDPSDSTNRSIRIAATKDNTEIVKELATKVVVTRG